MKQALTLLLLLAAFFAVSAQGPGPVPGPSLSGPNNWTGIQTFSAPIKTSSIVENKGSTSSGALAISGGTLTVPLGSNGNSVYWFTFNADFTLAISACPGPVTAFSLYSVGDGSTHASAWPVSVQWPNGVPPALTTLLSNQDIITFITRDNCTTWQSSINQNYGTF